MLSLFFIDEVAKYRDYDREDTLGDYARVFEEEYEALRRRATSASSTSTRPPRRYREHLERDPGPRDARGLLLDRQEDQALRSTATVAEDAATTRASPTDVDAYDLILKDKERLLSFEEPVRFIFSHSALREGWDNPNVFVMGMLKKSDNTISRRQEIGRGLRLSVDQHGERMDNPVTVHDINELTVVTDESYTDFVDRAAEGDRRVAVRPARARRASSSSPARRSSTESGRERRRGGARAGAVQLPRSRTTTSTTTAPSPEATRRPSDDGHARRADVRGAQAGHRLRLAAGRRALPRRARADRRPQAEEDPAQRGELRQEGVPGAVGPHQPQGRLPGRVRLGRADRQVHPGARQAPQRHRHAVRRRRPASSVDALEADDLDSRRRLRRLETTVDAHRDGVGGLPGASTTCSARSPRRPSSPAGPCAAILSRHQRRRRSRSSGRTPSSSSPRPPGSSTSRRRPSSSST